MNSIEALVGRDQENNGLRPNRIVGVMESRVGNHEKITWAREPDRCHKVNSDVLFLMKDVGFCGRVIKNESVS